MLITSTKNAGVDRIKTLIMGPYGVGKTYLASTIGEPTLLISAESGHLTLSSFDIDMIDMGVDVNGDVIAKEHRFDYLFKVIYPFLLKKETREKYKWIYIDSLTEIGDNCLEKLEADSRFSASKMTQARFGEYTKQMQNVIKLFRDIPYYNVVFTAISDEGLDSEGKQKKYKPLMPAQKLPDKIGMYFDEVFYMGIKSDKEGDKRYLQTQGTELIPAKDRSTKLNKFERPDLGVIAKKIRGVKQ